MSRLWMFGAVVSGLVGVVGGGCQIEPIETATSAQPLLGAELSTTDPAVVALLNNNGNVSCTGTLIAPTTVLTAAHCVEDTGGDGIVFFGDYTESGGTRIAIERSMAHPGWTGELSGGNDVGLILLAGPQDPDLPIRLNRESLTTHIGDPYRVVGFGIHDRVTRELDGHKRTAVMAIESLPGTYVEVTDPNPTQDPDIAICQGDSGGPGFITIGSEEFVAGVHSYSIEGCYNPSGDSRVDLFADTFIQDWVDANDPTCGADFICAPKGCSNDPDCQPCGADGTCVDGCELPDVDCPTQQVGEICRTNSQCLSGLCVFWDQDPRVKFCSSPCTDGCPDDMSCESVQPFGSICYYEDETPPGVVGAACEQATDCAEWLCEDGTCTYTCSIALGKRCPDGFMCEDDGLGARCYAEPSEEGGCCSTTSGGDPRGAIAIGGMVFVALMRRRRARNGR